MVLIAWTRTLFGVAGTTVSSVFPDTYVGDLQIKGPRPWVDVRTYATGGTGTSADPWTGWEASVNALAADTRIYFPAGVSRSAAVITAKAGWWIGGAGAASILRANAANFDLISVPAANVTISGLRLEGAATNEDFSSAMISATSAGTGLQVHRVVFSGPNATTGYVRGVILTGTILAGVSDNVFERMIGTQTSLAIFLQSNAQYNTISRNRMRFSIAGETKNGRIAIGLRTGASNNVISENIIRGGSGGTGAAGGSQISLVAFAADAIIRGNIISNNVLQEYDGASTEALEAAIEVGGRCHFNIVQGNYVSDTARHGILVEEDGTTSDNINNQIIGNIVRQSKRHGIFVRGTVDTFISHNQVYRNSQETANTYDGIHVTTDGSSAATRPRVIDNYGLDATGQRYSINVAALAPAPSNTVVHGNMADKGQTASINDGGTNTSLRNNKRSTGASEGRAVLVAGTVTVSTIEVLAGDNIHLTRVVTGGAAGHLSVGTITAETSFVINSSSGTDTSTVFWEVVH